MVLVKRRCGPVTRVVVDPSELVSPTASVRLLGIPLCMSKIVFGKPLLLYHRSGHSPQPSPVCYTE